MPRFRRQMAVLRSNKEIIDSVSIAVGAGVTTTVVLCESKNDYLGAVGTCVIGAKIKAIWLELTYNSESVNQQRLDWYLAKKPGSHGAFISIPGATGGNLERKFIFMERKGLNPKTAGGSPTKVAGWIRIPRRYQNMAEADKIQIAINASDVYSVCIKAIYKWFA